MRYDQHVLFGIGLGAAGQVLGIINLPPSFYSYPSYYGGLVLGSLLPDMDHPKSFLGNKLRPFSDFLYHVFGHRTFTHSLLFSSFLGTVLFVYSPINPLFSSGLFIGQISHLIADMLTPSGIALLYPSSRRFRIPFGTVGHK